MTIEELFKLKGELSWTIQVAQAKLNAVDQELIKFNNIETPKKVEATS